MSAWLLSIVGVVSLGVLLEILLEDGETSKYIKGVFAIAVVLVIVAPLPAFFKKEWNFDSFFNGKLHEPDVEFVENINQSQLASVEKYLKDKLISSNINVVDLTVVYEKNSRDIASVDVWVKGDVAVEFVADCVAKNINVELANVKVYRNSG